MRAKEIECLYGNLLDKAMKKESVEIHKEEIELIGNIVCGINMGRSFTEKNGEIESVHDLLTKSNGWKKMTVSSRQCFSSDISKS
ncbi:unnamed protein product [Eruca vesicaria subsp. sativa]|uniref:Uncharacterized protein n=1 Tax=Eruca vesicaria subsp. sativa TaxID=29727 RepID=A0ABC8M3U6_ERUVS|nr:unnamed protein product [Eruca vesicaria subsp. sativa]